ncbi:MAG: ABC transporter substrate-binding protein [Actinomycetota bacterium]
MALLFAGPLASASSASNQSSTLIPVDRQLYVVDGPYDPYAGDNSTIHVGVAGQSPTDGSQKELARSFVHIALDYLPRGSLISSVKLTLTVATAADKSNNTVYQTYNVNSNQALLQACVLTSALPAAIDASHPAPGYDCQHGSAVGAPSSDGTTWSFDLAPLLKAWSAAGNTGAAILPIANGASSAWTISFETGHSSSLVGYALAPAPTPTHSALASSAPSYYTIPVTVSKTYPFPTAPPAPEAVTKPTNAPAPQAAPILVSKPGPRSHTWRWVLPLCVGFALALMLIVHRSGWAVTSPSLRLRLVGDVQKYPRSYVVAAITTVWGMLFATYSIVVAPALSSSFVQTSGPQAQSQTSGPSANASGSGAPSVQSSSSTTYQTVQASGGPPIPGSEFSGPGTYRMIGTTRVFFPANGGPPAAELYQGQDDITGIDYTNKIIHLCGHAALTFGPAFNVSTSDINVYWSYLNAHGGIDGWKIEGTGSDQTPTWNDDGYDPGKAVAAAQSCKDGGAFTILGGIGFDQIPAVRQWAESNQQLYIHHIVTTAGSEGLRYSFTALPSEEQMGILAGNLAVQKWKDKKIGIIYRDSPNWTSGYDLFTKIVTQAGLKIVGHYAVTNGQGNYTQEIANLKNVDGANAVFVWENALYTSDIIKQAQAQQYYPDYIVFPFNLELATLGSSALSQKLYGVAAWDAYDPGQYDGPYASYAPLIREFEQQYAAQGDSAGPNNADGNDLLFLTWEGFDGLKDLLAQCLPQCTRNRMAAAMLLYHKHLPYYCDVDFTRIDGHHGGFYGNFFEAYADPSGKAAWRPTDRCVPVS